MRSQINLGFLFSAIPGTADLVVLNSTVTNEKKV